MTDIEKSRIEAICKTANVDDIGNLSDGFHTFNQLYYQRMILFATIVKQNRDKAWKSKRHEDGELCFGGGWFVVGITTPEGEYTYHYEEKDWDIFDCMELPIAVHWDGHTEKDVTRLLGLPSAEPKTEWIPASKELPKEGEEVLVWYEYFRYGDYNCMWQTYGIGWQYDGHFIVDNGGAKQRVRAWCPLPKEYKESEVGQ